jgi:methylated-DNA-[protein]-cysteine S-methyltransferase
MVTIRSAEGFLLFDTAIGHCGLAWGPRGIAGVLLPEGSEEETRRRMCRLHPGGVEARLDAAPLDETTRRSDEIPVVPAIAIAAVSRIRGLLEGERDDLLDLLLDMADLPPFHRRVYTLARQIGPGQTTTYGELARLLSEPSAARAVGQALARNPFAPVVPCHRVLAAGPGGLAYGAGGFSAGGGVVTKLRMLQIEGARLSRAPGLFD